MAQSEPCVPAISVVVATRNRRHLLPRLFEAFEAQDGAPPFEVIVVDDGSDDGTAELLDELANASPLDVRVHHLQQNRGPAAARNVGWRAARSGRIAFTDDDCHPQPGWLAAIALALESHDIAQGKTAANPTQQGTGWFSGAPQNDYERGFYETCNIGYRTETLAAIDGFDERFGARRLRRTRTTYVAPVWGEDTDLAWRAKARGALTTFVTDAVVWHDLKPGRMQDALADLPRRGGNAFLVKRHPGVRASFESPWFVQSAHAPALGSVCALIAALRSPRSLTRWFLAVGLIGIWARDRGRYFPKRSWPRALPPWFIVDVADVAVMAAASARNRTLLL
jgi:glycosyltransferase involved in cell wall biosynthesis